jgi:hypothetical protein
MWRVPVGSTINSLLQQRVVRRRVFNSVQNAVPAEGSMTMPSTMHY